ncbi:MAG: flagellar basal body P-ring formation protein FlgA [Paracoccus denitrificans]|uniref:Flagella basal body P-ring formation protein FlgA n=1 Tax=Paracoccus denitrificans TaxID=266 RepID=A0A533I5L9_PARDE|nr:MAG: flagellar basal body P-ring formation protein FlgA [Paracoccus denitrificans]
MRGIVLSLLLSAIPLGAKAAIVAAHNLPAGTVLSETDLVWDEDVAGGLTDPELAIGKQVRVAIYEGRPVVAGALRVPVLVSRNQIVRIAYDSGMLRIEAEGRALSEGAAGDLVRVMNLSSRKTISAVVAPDGTLLANAGTLEMK